MDCPICAAHQTETPLLNGQFWLVRSAPAAKNLAGYWLLEPKEHIESWSKLSPQAFMEYGMLLGQAVTELEQQHAPRKIYQVAIGEQVSHLHLHLVPHYDYSLKGPEYLKLVLEQGLPG